MVNPPTFMYIKTFEDTRKFILEKTHINLFVEWGYLGMFSSFARVDSAMFILEMDKRKEDSTFIKLNNLYEMKRKEVLFKAFADYLGGIPNDRVYTLPQKKLKGIKSYPFIYWISDEFREKFSEYNLEQYTSVEIGFITGKNEDGSGIAWDSDGVASVGFDPSAESWQNWRWIEQWLPHTTWYLMALATRYDEVSSDLTHTALPKTKSAPTFSVQQQGRLLTVNLKSNQTGKVLTVANLNGQKLYRETLSSTQTTVNLDNLQDGVYLVQVNGLGSRRILLK
jgi:hypothetical protein